MKIAIVGAGAVGGSLARLFVRVGHQVSISNSREPSTLAAFAGEIGATSASIWDAVPAADVVIIAIPTKAIPDLPRELFAKLQKDVPVVDTSNYHPQLRDGPIKAMDAGVAESQWVAQQINFPVIKAFNSILATNLVANAFSTNAENRIALPVSGDSPIAKACVRHLIEELGFDSVDAGSLGDSWRQQTGTPAYCTDLNASSLTLALASADRQLLSQYRARREADLQQMMKAQQASN